MEFLPCLRQQRLLVLQTAGDLFYAGFGFGPALLRLGERVAQLPHLRLLIIHSLLQRSRHSIGALRALSALKQPGMVA